ncbi:MAG: hypothetical protein NTY53_03370 [Kiritimatiellaeota bacterium]|nr:hypothetical protein [Verrucomicrobiota bacterium]MCX7006282.1 hypothetical protein [Kiritimatiellota bacterium]
MNKLALKIGIGLVVLFGIGVSTGVVVARQTHGVGRWAAGYKTYEDRWIAARIEEYKTQLHLTPEQLAAIRPHFDKLAADMREFRAELRTKVCGAFKEMNTGIARELPPAQREEFWKMLREKSERSQKGRNTRPGS